MLLFLLAFLGGILTILSPCVLPVIPFVFVQADRPFRSHGLPTLLGMAITFAIVASAAAVGGGWVVRANQIGRDVALVLLAAFGLALAIPALGDRLTQPLVGLGAKLQQRADAKAGIGGSLLLGVAVGFLWAPCAGPILGIILTGAALGGTSARTTLLLLAFGLGAATSLGIAIAAGSKLFAALKRGLGAEVMIRRVIGVLVLIGVVVVAMGWDTGILTHLSLANTSSAEQRLVDQLSGMPTATDASGTNGSGTNGSAANTGASRASATVAAADRIPDLSGATSWLNSPPLVADSLHGHVVLLDIWTYSCINCLRTLPYVKAWATRYAPNGLIVIGVHAPEFAFERDPKNVAQAVRDLGVTYPVALDNSYNIWKALNNEYWPAQYLIDTAGIIRYRSAGEGHDDLIEQHIRELLTQSGHPADAGEPTVVNIGGAQAAANTQALGSPETYIGYNRAERFVSPQKVAADTAQEYTIPTMLRLNTWALGGTWMIGPESATLSLSPGRIAFRFHARDVHLVLGPGPNDQPVRFRVLLDGQAPMENHGSDVSGTGTGTVTEQRLYQLIRQRGTVQDHTVEIEFLDPGVTAYAFTFG